MSTRQFQQRYMYSTKDKTPLYSKMLNRYLQSIALHKLVKWLFVTYLRDFGEAFRWIRLPTRSKAINNHQILLWKFCSLTQLRCILYSVNVAESVHVYPKKPPHGASCLFTVWQIGCRRRGWGCFPPQTEIQSHDVTLGSGTGLKRSPFIIRVTRTRPLILFKWASPVFYTSTLVSIEAFIGNDSSRVQMALRFRSCSVKFALEQVACGHRPHVTPNSCLVPSSFHYPFLWFKA